MSARFERAFTLLEVMLALSIAVAILTVALYFYRQVENLRTELAHEAMRIAAVRLFLDRLTTELSSARLCESLQKGMSGGSNQIQFVKLDWPNASLWTNAPDAVVTNPPTAFRLIGYSVGPVEGATNSTGLTRTEEPIMRKRSDPALEGEAMDLQANAPTHAMMLTDALHYVRFRFWNGTGWLDSWTGPELPFGVEVTLGAEPLPELMTPDEYPHEIYRRTIFLPNHASGASTQPAATTELEGL